MRRNQTYDFTEARGNAFGMPGKSIESHDHMITSSKSSKSFLGTTNVSMGPVQQSGMQTDVFSDLKCWVATAAL